MRDTRTMMFGQQDSIEARCDAVLLGRLGCELSTIYRDTLMAPLPAGLQLLIDRLDAALGDGTGPRVSGGSKVR